MTRTKPGVMEALALEYRCEQCNAKPYRWCVTVRGRDPGKKWAQFLHGFRTGPLYDAYSNGYTEYEQFLVSLDEDDLKRHFQWVHRIKARRVRGEAS